VADVPTLNGQPGHRLTPSLRAQERIFARYRTDFERFGYDLPTAHG
jgi:hypothetical protein